MGKYQAYPEYKNSDAEWVKAIPIHWKTASLSKLFSIKAGGDVKTELLSEEKTAEYPFPIYTNANDEKAIYGYTSKSNYLPNTITVSGRGEVGFAAYRDHAYDAIIRLLVLTPTGEISGKFFAYYINEAIDFRVESSAIGQLSTQQIAPYKVVFPSFNEQQKIANFLDHETAKIDTLIEKQQQLIALLKEKRQAVISHAVTKGLNANAPMRDSGVEWLGEVPVHWDEVSRIKYISSLKGRQGWQGLKADEYLEEGPHVVSSAHFTNHQIQWDACPRVSPARYERDNNIQLSEGDLLLMKDGAAMGKLAYVDELPGRACLNSHLLLFRPKKRNEVMAYSPRFMYYFMQTEFFQSHIKIYGTGVTFLGISQQAIGNYRLVFPPLSEQQEITEILERETGKLDELAKKQQNMMFLLQERRTALISAAVTGKIDVRDWQAPEPSIHKNKEAVG